MKTRSLVCLMLILATASPAEAVINCFDYAFYRATGIDPRPTTSPISSAVGVSHLQCYLGALGYTQLPNPPRDDRDLRSGDVLIFGTAHAGFVNAQGSIDHFIMIWGASGKKYDTNALPRAGVYRSPRPDYPDPPDNKPSGHFSNATLEQFIKSAFRPSGQVYQWRRTGAATIPARDLLALELPLYQAEKALKTGKLSEADQAIAQAKRIASPPACLAQTLTELAGRYDASKPKVEDLPAEGMRRIAGTWTGSFTRHDTGGTGGVSTVFTVTNGKLEGWHYTPGWVIEDVSVSGNVVTFAHKYAECRARHTFTIRDFAARTATSKYTVSCPGGKPGHTGTITYP